MTELRPYRPSGNDVTCCLFDTHVWAKVKKKWEILLNECMINKWGCVIMKFAYHNVILSNAKNLISSTLCIQILHDVQDDTTF